MANTVEIMELYTAYFNRAADKAGVDYWANEMDANGWTLDQVAQSFADQPEYQAIYGNLTNEGTIVEIYKNLLNREQPDAEGLAYWEEQLDSGAIQISNMVQAIINGAQGSDIAIIDNKTAVSQYAYDAGLEATDAKTISLENITADPSTIASAKAAIDAINPANVGETFTLTAGSTPDAIVGTAKNDTINATQTTYQASDVIIDSSSTDNDTLNLTTNSDITATPTVVGIENMNVQFSGFTAAGGVSATTLDIAMNNVGATKLNVTNSGSTAVNAVSATLLATGSEVTTDSTFKTVTLTADDNATLKVNTNAATATTTSTVSADSAGTLTDVTVKESTGHVSVTTDSDTTLVVDGAKDVTVNAAAVKTATITSGEDVVITSLAAATTVDITAVKTVSGDADAATTVNIVAGGKITNTSLDAAKEITVSAAGIDARATGGTDNSSAITADALTTLNVSGNGAALELDVALTSDTLKTINVSGDQDVAVTLDLAGFSTTNKLTLANTGTAQAKLVLTGDAVNDAVNISGVEAATKIALNTNQTGTGVVTVATGADITIGADQTNLILTADSSTALTNSVNLTVDKPNTTTETVAITKLTTTNFKTVNLDLSKDAVNTTLGTVDVSAANNLNVVIGSKNLTSVTDIVASTAKFTGAGDITLGDLTIAELDASGMTGKVSYTVQDGDVVRTGSNDDTLTLAAAAIDTNIQTGAGNDSITFTANQDYSNKTVVVDMGEGSLDTITLGDSANIAGDTVSITGFEKIVFDDNLATVNDKLLNGSSASVFGGANTNVVVRVTQATNDFSSLAIDTATISTAGGDKFTINASGLKEATNIVGTDADDVITGANTAGVYADVLNGGLGNDTLVATQGGDSLIGGTGTDTANLSNLKASNIEGGTSVSTGVVVNLGTTAISQANVASTLTGSFISKGLTEVAANTVAYAFSTDATTNSTVVTTLSGIENVIGTAGNDYIVGSTAANVINGGAGNDYIIGGLGIDTIDVGAGTDTVVLGTVEASADAITTFTSGTDKLKITTTLLNGANTTITNAGDISNTVTVDAAIAISATATQYVFSNAAFDIDASLSAFLAAPSTTTAAAVTTAAATALKATAMTNLDATFLATETVLFVLDGTAGTSGAVFSFTNSTAAGNTIDAGELVLLGVTDAVLVDGDIIA